MSFFNFSSSLASLAQEIPQPEESSLGTGISLPGILASLARLSIYIASAMVWKVIIHLMLGPDYYFKVKANFFSFHGDLFVL